MCEINYAEFATQKPSTPFPIGLEGDRGRSQITSHVPDLLITSHDPGGVSSHGDPVCEMKSATGGVADSRWGNPLTPCAK